MGTFRAGGGLAAGITSGPHIREPFKESDLMERTSKLALFLGLCCAGAVLTSCSTLRHGAPPALHVEELAPIPDHAGFASMYAGFSNGMLIAAGGANFPDGPFWEGGTKQWHDRIFIYDPGLDEWSLSETRLPERMAYGAYGVVGERLICAGGETADGVTARAFALSYTDGEVRLEDLPPLPEPVAYCGSVAIGDVLYVAGGDNEKGATQASDRFHALDLSRPGGDLRWETLPTWPGPERRLTTAATDGEHLYLMGGMRLRVPPEGELSIIRPYLRDLYRYTPETGEWVELASKPRSLIAGPNPAPFLDGRYFLLAGGINEPLLDHPDPATHPGILHDVLAYDIETDSWSEWDDLPRGAGRVTVTAIPFRDGAILLNGEIYPAIRTTAVTYISLGPQGSR